ncbi:MAG TPA: MBL fold metallo-hydrolase [Candidatus Avacidaminococcus intestinavium]|uniref:MBL fold metallo-hydrolase n=1 Tax=Candidatus Avacidaminococcus intestinavium TaxID=2840684 RepID=A0A9D1MP90_9FIRM|nr:MBL fold metallo-hydrolase [Candidatus Avacidaminococcus intestinavium]
MNIFQVRGNTFCINTGMTYIPFYKLNAHDIIMLDSGWAEGEQQGITNLLIENSFNIKAIINTHSHTDHIGNNSFFKAKYNCLIAMPELEAFICHSPLTLKLYFHSLPVNVLKKQFGHMINQPDFLISEQQTTITICNTTFQIIHTPGHSIDHICLITPDDVAYLGDTLISHKVMRGAKMPYAYLLNEDLASKKLLYQITAQKYIIAHKGCYEDIQDLITLNIDFYQQRAKEILSLIKESASFEEITMSVIKNFRIPIHSLQKHLLIERMLHSYLDYLYETKQITVNLSNGYVRYSALTNN